MRRNAVQATVALALSLAVGGCGGERSTGSTSSAETSTETGAGEPAPSGEAARSEKVEIIEFSYGPDPAVVQVGGKVTWLNKDTAPHTATADDGSFATEVIDPGKLASATFKRAGTFPYFCEIHPTMHGIVEVVEKD